MGNLPLRNAFTPSHISFLVLTLGGSGGLSFVLAEYHASNTRRSVPLPCECRGLDLQQQRGSALLILVVAAS
jgi:hypothetical protein